MLCKVSPQTFEIVVDGCQYHDTFNLRVMVNEIKLPLKIYVAPNNVFWNIPLVVAIVSEKYVIDIVSLRYKNTKIFYNFHVGACQ